MSLPQPASLNHLLSNNAQWAEEFEFAEPGFLRKSSWGQTPQVLWIGCADSRVPESLITGARPGDIFVHRNIANQVHLDDDNILSVLTYAIGSLGVRHVVVVGHSECGGAAACLNAVQRPTGGSITTIPSLSPDAPLNRWLDPLTKHLGSLQLSDMPKADALPIVVQENVKRQVEHVCKTRPVIDAWSNDDPEKRNVWVHGWVYDLASGRLRDLGISSGPKE